MTCRKHLPELTIRRRPDLSPDHGAISIQDLEILLDGQPVKGLEQLTLELEPRAANRLTLRLGVHIVEVTPEALVTLQALAEQDR